MVRQGVYLIGGGRHTVECTKIIKLETELHHFVSYCQRLITYLEFSIGKYIDTQEKDPNKQLSLRESVGRPAACYAEPA